MDVSRIGPKDRSRPPRHGSRAGFALVLLALLAGSGCTPFTSFHGDFDAMRACGFSPAALSGAWDGYWVSHKSGHKGCLKAIISPCGDGVYNAHFHATFFKVMSGEYSTTLRDAWDGETHHFSGQKNLGRLLGGVYTFTGTATASEFVCYYRCCKDHGLFYMRRRACGSCDAAPCDAVPCDAGPCAAATPATSELSFVIPAPEEQPSP